MSNASPQPQQINVTDLDLPQLAEVKKQLEEVRGTRTSQRIATNLLDLALLIPRTGTQPPYELVHTAQASSGQVQSVH